MGNKPQCNVSLSQDNCYDGTWVSNVYSMSDGVVNALHLQCSDGRFLGRVGGWSGTSVTQTQDDGFKGASFRVSKENGLLNSATLTKRDGSTTQRIGKVYKDDVEASATCGPFEVITGADLRACGDHVTGGAAVRCSNPFVKFCSSNMTTSGICKDLRARDNASWLTALRNFCGAHTEDGACEDLRSVDPDGWLKVARDYCEFDRMGANVCKEAAGADGEWYKATMIAACQQGDRWKDDRCKAFCGSSPGSCGFLKSVAPSHLDDDYFMCYRGMSDINKAWPFKDTFNDPKCFLQGCNSQSSQHFVDTDYKCTPVCLNSIQVSNLSNVNLDMSNVQLNCSNGNGPQSTQLPQAATTTTAPGTGVTSVQLATGDGANSAYAKVLGEWWARPAVRYGAVGGCAFLLLLSCACIIAAQRRR